MFSQKGLMDKNQTTKDGILKGTTKDNKEIAFFGPFYKTKEHKPREKEQ